MPPTDAPRVQLAGSTRARPTALLAAALVLLVARVGTGLYEERHPPETPDLVRWRPVAGAEAEARRLAKPLLYDFTADWCTPCQAMRREVFADRNAAEQINRLFVPVQVLDRKREEGRNPAVVDSLQRRFRVDGFPTLVVVSPAGGDSVVLAGYPGKIPTLRRLTQAQARMTLPARRPGAPGFP